MKKKIGSRVIQGLRWLVGPPYNRWDGLVGWVYLNTIVGLIVWNVGSPPLVEHPYVKVVWEILLFMPGIHSIWLMFCPYKKGASQQEVERGAETSDSAPTSSEPRCAPPSKTASRTEANEPN